MATMITMITVIVMMTRVIASDHFLVTDPHGARQ